MFMTLNEGNESFKKKIEKKKLPNITILNQSINQ